ncbi:LCP family protein [Lysinibacillus sphaericus]|uniref:LCP family protein n=1 Tax=Lysinibacillus sphaericus TaxID=1421 RepID=UPI0018CDA270|nr:LCP family protein [Lysinibacillus sphaericus]
MRKRMQIIEENKTKKKRWILISIILVIIAAFLIAAFVYFKLDRYEYKELNATDEELGIEKPPAAKAEVIEEEEPEPETELFKDEIINIALFGLDRRDTNSKNTRSDSMMVATVDFYNKKVKLTALMRDMYVDIDGRGKDKLNHAYAYGGPELAIKTINHNFGLDVRNYVTVDFFMLSEMIDILGGVEIDVKQEEINLLNEHMGEVMNIKAEQMIKVEKPGKQLLNGDQAVAYSRIRKVGQGDFERSARQQQVLQEMLKGVQNASKTELVSLFLKISPYIETSLTKEEILKIGWSYLANNPMPIEKMRYPLDNQWSSSYTDSGMWIMNVDMFGQKKSIQNWIYEDINPYETDKQKDLKGEEPEKVEVKHENAEYIDKATDSTMSPN